MDVYVARQPIFNRRQQVVAYELLYREGEENYYPAHVDGFEATAKMLNNTLVNNGFGWLTNDKPALLNFTQQGITERVPKMLPPSKVVIEILETVSPNDEVYEEVLELFKAGYKVALDDFVYEKAWSRFLPLVKMIKIDIMETPLHTVEEFVRHVKKHPSANVRRIKFLAEKVEDREQFSEAVEMGFEFFQGYFFAKPEMLKSKDLAPQSALLLAIFQESVKPELNVNRIESLFKQDLAITYKLLAYLNSGVFELRNNIDSIKTAIVYLGQDKMRRFIALLVTAGLRGNKSMHLIESSIYRARFCEVIAQNSEASLQQSGFFIGLLSYLDALLNTTMTDALKNISVSEDIVEALTVSEDDSMMSEKGELLKSMLDVVKAHETGDFDNVKPNCEKLNLNPKVLPKINTDTLAWVNDFVGNAKIAE